MDFFLENSAQFLHCLQNLMGTPQKRVVAVVNNYLDLVQPDNPLLQTRFIG